MRYTEFCEKVLDLFAAFELAAMYHHDLHIHVERRALGRKVARFVVQHAATAA